MADTHRPSRRSDAGYQANRLARLLRRELTAELGGLGLTSRQAAVLLALADGDGMTMGDLADRLGVDKPTLSGVVRRLERAARLHVSPHPDDGRSRIVRLSRQGAAALPELRAASGRVTRRALRDLDTAERDRFFSLLERICVALEGGETGKGEP